MSTDQLDELRKDRDEGWRQHNLACALLAEAYDEIIEYGSQVPFSRRNYGPMLRKIHDFLHPDSLHHAYGPDGAEPYISEGAGQS